MTLGTHPLSTIESSPEAIRTTTLEESAERLLFCRAGCLQGSDIG